MPPAHGSPPSFQPQAPIPTHVVREAAGRNRLFAAWPARVREELLREARLVSLRPNRVLFHIGATLTHALFPVSGLIVGFQRDKSGASVVVGHAGTEGFLGGVTAFEDVATARMEINVLLAGQAIAIPIAHARDAITSSATLRRDIIAWNQHILLVALQNVSCSRFHSVAERVACWLLLLHDHLDGAARIPITHDLLSQTLGVHRPSVTLALQNLVAQDVLAPGRRGIVAIHDHERLQQTSCECYEILRQNNHLRAS